MSFLTSSSMHEVVSPVWRRSLDFVRPSLGRGPSEVHTKPSWRFPITRLFPKRFCSIKPFFCSITRTRALVLSTFCSFLSFFLFHLCYRYYGTCRHYLFCLGWGHTQFFFLSSKDLASRHLSLSESISLSKCGNHGA